MTAPEERFRDHICPKITTREEVSKTEAHWQLQLPLNTQFLHSLNCSNIIPSRWRVRTMAGRGSRHQSLMMEGGTSLAGEDRGEGGWNRLDDAVERELLRLSERGKRAWKEREWQVGWGWGERQERERTDDGMNEKVNMSEEDNKRQQRKTERSANERRIDA